MITHASNNNNNSNALATVASAALVAAVSTVGMWWFRSIEFPQLLTPGTAKPKVTRSMPPSATDESAATTQVPTKQAESLDDAAADRTETTPGLSCEDRAAAENTHGANDENNNNSNSINNNNRDKNEDEERRIVHDASTRRRIFCGQTVQNYQLSEAPTKPMTATVATVESNTSDDATTLSADEETSLHSHTSQRRSIFGRKVSMKHSDMTYSIPEMIEAVPSDGE